MRHPWTQLYAHLVWSTVGRAPLITALLQPRIYGCIQDQAARLGVDVIAMGGVSDHVHVLVRLQGKHAVADVVKQMKGGSSHFVTKELGEPFAWQGGYGAFSVGKRAVPVVRDYVLNQSRHHQEGTTYPELERTID